MFPMYIFCSFFLTLVPPFHHHPAAPEQNIKLDLDIMTHCKQSKIEMTTFAWPYTLSPALFTWDSLLAHWSLDSRNNLSVALKQVLLTYRIPSKLLWYLSHTPFIELVHSSPSC